MKNPRPPHRSRPAGLPCLCLAGLVLAAAALPARAESTARRIALTGAGDAHRLDVHPAYVTVIDFPSPIIRVIRSDATRFTVEATDRRVFVRPLGDAAPGTLANLQVITETGLVTVLLHITEQPEEADAHIAFTAPAPPARAPPDLSLTVGAMLGSADFGARDRVIIGGLEAELAYARSAAYSLVAAATLGQTENARNAPWAPSYHSSPVSGMTLDHAGPVVRLLSGIRLHRGERLRIRGDALAGVQIWHISAAGRQVQGSPQESRDSIVLPSSRSRWRADSVFGAGLGVDLALWRRWAAGFGIRVLRTWRDDTLAFDSIESVVTLRWP